jgi:purine-binding chemotaxis protein CheW
MSIKDNMQIVTFKVSDEIFALSIVLIQEIIRMTNIVKVPKAPDFVEGVINLRGKVIPVVDLKKKFGFPDKKKDVHTRVIIAEAKGMTVGLVVDEVCEVLRADAGSSAETPSIVSGVDQKFISRIVKHADHMIMVIELDQLFSSNEAEILKDAH